MIPKVGRGTRPWGFRGKRSVSVSKSPKPPIQLLQLLKNSSREAKRVYFRYILVPPGPTQEMKLMGPGGEGPSRSPPVSPAMGGGGRLQRVLVIPGRHVWHVGAGHVQTLTGTEMSGSSTWHAVK